MFEETNTWLFMYVLFPLTLFIFIEGFVFMDAMLNKIGKSVNTLRSENGVLKQLLNEKESRIKGLERKLENYIVDSAVHI
jgi:hypothetical protein